MPPPPCFFQNRHEIGVDVHSTMAWLRSNLRKTLPWEFSDCRRFFGATTTAQTEELPPANFTDGILNSDCLLPCLERTSNCLSEPTSHHMRATLQDMETACGSILRIVLWNRCPSSALSSSTHPSQPSLRLAPPSALRRRQHSGLFHFRQPQDHGASSVVFCRSPQERHVESGPLVTDLPCNVLSINNDNTSGQPPD